MNEDQHLDEDARKAIASGDVIARIIKGDDGRIYNRTVEPYHSDVGGVVVRYKPVDAGLHTLPPELEFKSLNGREGETGTAVQSLTKGVSQIGVWTLEDEGARVNWDQRFSQITQLSPPVSSLEESGFLGCLPDEDRLAFEQGLETVADGGATVDTEVRFVPPGGSMIWLLVRCVRVFQDGCPMLVGIIADITERKDNKKRSEFMMRELDHRVKNMLAIILSIAEITARSNNDISTYKNDFRGRLESMARIHNLLAQTQWTSSDLETLILEEVGSLATSGTFTLSGPSLEISPSAAQSLAMFFHELTVNALKHGALSVDEGRVSVSWETADGPEPHLSLVWKELGGPVVSKPAKEGFGARVINRIVKRQLDAAVETEWGSDGMVLTAHFPLTAITTTPNGQTSTS